MSKDFAALFQSLVRNVQYDVIMFCVNSNSVCQLTAYIYSVGRTKAIVDFYINKIIFHGLSAYIEICVLRRKHNYVSFIKIGISQAQGQRVATVSGT